MKILRTQDSFYATEKSKNIKESFVEVANFIEKHESPIMIADIGCAVGMFPMYLSKRFPRSSVTRFEYSQELLSTAKELFPGLDLRFADILDSSFSEANREKFDVVTLLGVLSIFDDIEIPLHNIKKMLKPGGLFLAHGLFNPYPLDVYIKYQSSMLPHSDLEAGWNIVSQKKVVDACQRLGFFDMKFHEFSIKANLERHPDDPVRSWTEILVDGRKQIVNGLCIKQPQYIFEATC